MEKLLEKLNQLSLPIAILIASLVLGGFILTAQVIKQKSIERQQQVKIKQEQKEEVSRQLDLAVCLSKADEKYWALLQLNGVSKAEEGGFSVRAPVSVYETADKIKQKDIDNCYKQYK